MWKIFYLKNKDQLETMQIVSSWKSAVFSRLDVKIKQYFAEKVVVHFDNRMIFQNKKGMHENLLESLALAEENLKNYTLLFKEIKAYLISEENGDNFLIVSNLPEEESFHPLAKNGYGFDLLENDAIPMQGKFEKLEHLSWSTLVFHSALSDFYRGWINYTPSIEKRSELQATFILANVHFKKNNLTLTEKVEYEKSIKNEEQFEDLYHKVLKIMPKIESSLDQEWRITIVKNARDKKKGIKK